jgi:hypothetical protein
LFLVENQHFEERLIANIILNFLFVEDSIPDDLDDQIRRLIEKLHQQFSQVDKFGILSCSNQQIKHQSIDDRVEILN